MNNALQLIDYLFFIPFEMRPDLSEIKLVRVTYLFINESLSISGLHIGWDSLKDSYTSRVLLNPEPPRKWSVY
jgi:hypothetical protein